MTFAVPNEDGDPNVAFAGFKKGLYCQNQAQLAGLDFRKPKLLSCLLRAGGEVKDECFGKSRGEEALRVKERDFTPQA